MRSLTPSVSSSDVNLSTNPYEDVIKIQKKRNNSFLKSLPIKKLIVKKITRVRNAALLYVKKHPKIPERIIKYCKLPSTLLAENIVKQVIRAPKAFGPPA